MPAVYERADIGLWDPLVAWSVQPDKRVGVGNAQFRRDGFIQATVLHVNGVAKHFLPHVLLAVRGLQREPACILEFFPRRVHSQTEKKQLVTGVQEMAHSRQGVLAGQLWYQVQAQDGSGPDWESDVWQGVRWFGVCLHLSWTLEGLWAPVLL